MSYKNGPTVRKLCKCFLSSTEKGYDLLAPEFDHTSYRTPDWVLKAVVSAIGPVGSAQSGLDVCCGTGAATRAIRPLCRDHVVGLDISEGMLTVAREESLALGGRPHIDFIRADVLDIPFVDEFDLVVCLGALGHIQKQHQHQFIDQIAKTLQPRGRFITLAPDKYSLVSWRYWASLACNIITRVRNILIRPRFIMYYGHCSWPRIKELLKAHTFKVEVKDLGLRKPYSNYRLLVASKVL